MARKPPPEHTRWKKGVSGNPGGKNQVTPALKAFHKISTEELRHLVAKYFRATEKEVDAVLADESASMLDKFLCAVIKKSTTDADPWRAEVLWNRTLGKVTEKIEVKHPEPVMIERPSGEIIDLDVKEAEQE